MKHLLLLAFSSLLFASAALAEVPYTMNVQGRLLNAGNPMTGTHPAIFSIYDAASAGTVLWTESSSLDVLNGVFSAQLGAVTPIPTIVFDAQPRWLEVTVNANTMSPRLPLTTGAYAFRAQRADTATVALSGIGGGNQWESDGTNVWRSGGKVGIGVSQPATQLDVAGMVRFGGLGFSPSWPEVAFNAYHTPSTEVYALDGSAFSLIHDPTSQSLNAMVAPPGIAGATVPWGYGFVLDSYGRLGLGTAWPLARLQVNGAVLMPGSAWNQMTRPAVGTGRVTGEVAGGNPSGLWADDGFLRLSAGGGTASWTKSFIDLSGYSTVPDMYQNIVLGTSGSERMRIDANGNITMTGNLSVTGTKCRVVQTRFGEVAMNAVESGHALFTDDEPTARLVNGRCRVNLSPRFLATVTVNGRFPLTVNVTFYGHHGGEWYVERDATGFTVIDPSGSNAEFSWEAKARQLGYETLQLEPASHTAER